MPGRSRVTVRASSVQAEARAGEQDRGFSVVASEVRALAQRSALAAKNIKQLIAESTEPVAEGARLVDHAGSTMRDVVGEAGRRTGLMSAIFAACAEQAAGVGQVSQAVQHMDEGTQRNAALVEQASASVHALGLQAEQRVQAVPVFRVAGEASARAASCPHIRAVKAAIA